MLLTSAIAAHITKRRSSEGNPFKEVSASGIVVSESNQGFSVYLKSLFCMPKKRHWAI
jgi:hypothetical protein